VGQEKSVDAVSFGKRPGTHLSSQTSVVSQARLSEGVAIVPPKLIKSVRAIASPNALQYFDKGNTATVTLDAVVDSSGHVKSMKVLSGPASLRSAAMDALKQYRYEPAKLRGRPVAAHVTVKVEFLFEP
jgi:TonB family protein